MTESGFTRRDIEQIENRGISPDVIKSQLDRFRSGVTHPRLLKPCTVGDGVTRLSDEEQAHLSTVFQQAVAQGRVTKFVPASGAATRMFEGLLSFLHDNDAVTPLDRKTVAQQAARKEADAADLIRFCDHLKRFAFYDDLSRNLADKGQDMEKLIEGGDIRDLLDCLLMPRGLGYADLPKGMILFHRYKQPNGTVVRTGFEEHLAEGAEYFSDQAGCCRQHFTVAPDYQTRIEAHLRHAGQQYRQAVAPIDFNFSFSVQKAATDTIAADMANQPFRDGDGRLMFRPGGHGALLENLNDLDGDIVFIKNIDNIARKSLRMEVLPAVHALGGILVELQQAVFAYLEKERIAGLDAPEVDAAMEFIQQRFHRHAPDDLPANDFEKKKAFIVSGLNRPLRVCGVVRHAGEPGGGPFQVQDRDGRTSMQIVEAVQVNMADAEQRGIWEASTHFNPVIIACGLRDHQGKPFDLRGFADPAAGIITEKSCQGRPLKALEHPGLWNGGMAQWNTVFVELPPASFNPVKTVLDLLRDGHQS